MRSRAKQRKASAGSFPAASGSSISKALAMSAFDCDFSQSTQHTKYAQAGAPTSGRLEGWMKAMSLWLVALFTLDAARAGEPEIFQNQQFNAAMMARSVNHYVAMGEPAAREALARLARRADQSEAQDRYPSTFAVQDIASRVSWMCLILWPARPGAVSRPPMFGGLYAIEGHVRPDSFPLYPVAQSGDAYFVLAEEYVVAGRPETASHFLEDCQSHGSFRRQPVAVPTREEARRDVSMLRQSAGWTAARATGPQAGWEPLAWAFIQAQADSIP